MPTWSRLIFQALWCAIVAAVPACAVAFCTNDIYVLLLTGYLPSALLFFTVLLVEFHGMQAQSAFGHVLSTYIGMTIRNIPIVGAAVELHDIATQKEGPAPAAGRPETPEEARRADLELWIGGTVGAAVCAVTAASLLFTSKEKEIVESCFLVVLFGACGVMLGMIFAIAIGESIALSAARRLIVPNVLYGIVFGALMGATLFSTKPGGAAFMIAIWTVFGTGAGVFGWLYRQSQLPAA